MALIPLNLYRNIVVFSVYYFLLFCGDPIASSTWLFNMEARNLLWLINLLRWILIFVIHLLYWIIKILQLPLRLFNTLYSALIFWPKFYWHLLGPNSKGRSIIDILRDPAGSSAFKRRSSKRRRLDDYQIKFGSGGFTGSTFTIKFAKPFSIKFVLTTLPHKWFRIVDRHGGGISPHIRPTLSRYNVFSSYQVDGAWCFLATINKQVADSLTAAMDSKTLIPFFDDPLKLACFYAYVAVRITEPPDCALQTIWALSWHIFYASAYLIRGYGYLLWTFIRGSSTDTKQKVPKKKVTKIRKVHCLSTEMDSSDDPICFDSDGIPFLIDSGANCIISNVRRLFIDVSPEEVSVTTHSGNDQRQRYVGTFLLQLPDDDGVVHTYKVPDSIYDPHTSYNIIGVSRLSTFFGDVVPGNNPRDLDGTRVMTGGARSHMVWDHGKHELHWMHKSGLPVLPLYKGTSYFSAFCTRMSKAYDDCINYAFSSSYSISPHRNSKAEGDGSTEYEVDQDQTGWYDPVLCGECDPTESHPFKLGAELIYTQVDPKKKEATTISVVYEGVNADGMTHIIRMPDGTKQNVHKSTLQGHLQANFGNIPQTPFEYQQEVGVGISQEDAQRLARPSTLSPAQQELLSWHHRLYHLSFDKLFKLVKLGLLPKSLLGCEETRPICLECQFGAAKRRPWRHKGKKSGTIRKDSEKKPGDGVSVDQIVSAQPGLIPQMSGFLTSDRLWGATTFVDHVSDYVYVHLMKNFSIEETLSAKASFERIFTLAGREVKAYRADNGRFADKKWHDDCVANKQSVTFCGVGNHRQNGVVEAKNKYLTLTARTLLLQGMRMWPEMISTYFWPFAVKAAAERHNKLHVDKDGNTPESKLYGIELEDIPVTTFHPLFCPVFVLDHRLHSAGGSIPKWEPRSRCGVYLGHSPLHAGNVALVFNPITGRVSPAYHVVFDDTWSTVPFMKAATMPPNWEDLVKNSKEIATIEEFELADDWIKKTEAPRETLEPTMDSLPAQDSSSRITDPFAVMHGQHKQDSELSPASAPQTPDETAVVQPSEGEDDNKSSKRVTFNDDCKPAASEHPPKRPKFNDGTSTAPQSLENTAVENAPQDDNPWAMPQILNLDEAGLRRSSRIAARKAKANLTIGGITLFVTCLFTAMTTVGSFSMPDHNRHRNNPNAQEQSPSLTERMMNKFHEANELYDGTCNSLHFLSFMTQDVASNEVFHYHQVMKLDDCHEFIEAMKKEIRDHEVREHWVIVPKSSMPKGNKAIKSIWSFKRKRTPAGELMKHKARLCAHGGMQQWGENYWETYSPVVNMLTVRLLLLICKIHNLESRSIDFVLAFPQAELEEDIWMELPLGVDVGEEYEGEYLLKLKRNLYGLKQASHNWFNHLKEGLEHRGLRPSEVDPCLYLKNGLAVLTYVDDCILISTSKQAIDTLIESLEKGTKEKPEKFILTDEGDIDKFLGIEIEHHDDGSFEISQPHLITRILTLLRLDANNEWKTSTNGKQLPGEKLILHKDENGDPRRYEEHWNYRTAIGMLTYLQGNSRPDISVHVHQCARFSINPRRSHERAIVQIGRYLLTTRNRGILYKPDKTKGLECYVDADFAGGWQKADADSACSVMSRTGYVLMYAGCPIHWVSKLQTEIALSTAEAEYIALSQSLREVIPLMDMMKELKNTFPIHITIPNFNCTVHEDNQSCISMATKQKFSPRTKHIALKYHHFRSYVNSKKIDIHYIKTGDQIADALTKPLDKNLFFGLRKMLMGW